MTYDEQQQILADVVLSSRTRRRVSALQLQPFDTDEVIVNLWEKLSRMLDRCRPRTADGTLVSKTAPAMSVDGDPMGRTDFEALLGTYIRWALGDWIKKRTGWARDHDLPPEPDLEPPDPVGTEVVGTTTRRDQLDLLLADLATRPDLAADQRLVLGIGVALAAASEWAAEHGEASTVNDNPLFSLVDPLQFSCRLTFDDTGTKLVALSDVNARQRISRTRAKIENHLRSARAIEAGR